jgi:hypothetical protein
VLNNTIKMTLNNYIPPRTVILYVYNHLNGKYNTYLKIKGYNYKVILALLAKVKRHFSR